VHRKYKSPFSEFKQVSGSTAAKLTPGLTAAGHHWACVNAFVTWNTREFMKRGIKQLVDFPVVVPGDCRDLLRKWLEPYLE
jgi:transposase